MSARTPMLESGIVGFRDFDLGKNAKCEFTKGIYVYI